MLLDLEHQDNESAVTPLTNSVMHNNIKTEVVNRSSLDFKGDDMRV